MGAWDELDTEISVDNDLTDLDMLLSLDDDYGVFEPLHEIVEDLKSSIEEGTQRGVYELSVKNISFQEKWINQNCKNPSGILATSIIGDEEDDGYTIITGTIINHIYPMSVEYGADIYPVTASVLRFPAPDDWDGDVDEDGFVYLKEAHPPAHPFVAPAYDDTVEIAEEIMVTEIGHAGVEWDK